MVKTNENNIVHCYHCSLFTVHCGAAAYLVPVMKEAIKAYHNVTTSDEFKEIARLRSLALHNEASALDNARREERKKWQGVVADKETELAEKDAVLVEKDSEIARLEALIEEFKKHYGEDK